MYRLQETLATLLITRQLTQNLTEIAMPFLMEKLRLCKLTYRMTKTMSNHSLRRHVEAVRKRRDTSSELSCSNQDNLVAGESSVPYEESVTLTADSPSHNTSRNSLWSSMRLRRSNVSNRSLRILNSLSKDGAPASTVSVEQKLSSTRLPLPEFCPNESDDFELTEAELQSLMTAYCRPLDDYLEMFIQFGYVLLFSPAFH
uniref:Anoctamin n=1 Tax=Ditylenchus dipsaci TaxID=166011 RepID=A0A915EIV5_9BILA